MRFALKTATVALFALLHPIALGQARSDEQVSLAGSFNNWNAGDSEYRLTRVRDRYELRRRWICGSYTFKFTFNASWNRHLGAADADRLEQPGRDIELAVPQTGLYTLWLDVESRRWGLERAEPTRPEPVLIVRGAAMGCGELALDGRASLPAQNRPLAHAEFTVRRMDSIEAVMPTRLSANLNGLRARHTLDRPGRYEVCLRLDEGKSSEQTCVTVNAGHGWLAELRGRDGNTSRLQLLPLGDGRWAASLPSDVAPPTQIRIRPAVGNEQARPAATLEAPASSTGPSWIMFNPTDRAAVVVPARGHEFTVRAADLALPPGLLVERIDVVGDFNQWRIGSAPMYDEPDDRFRRIVELPEGVYAYKFVVNAVHWREDPRADPRFRSSAGKDNFNSGVLVGDDAARFGPPRPVHVCREAVRHDPSRPDDVDALAADVARIGLRTLADDVESVTIEGDGLAESVELTKSATRFGFDYWTAFVQHDAHGATYEFVLRDGDEICRLDDAGIQPGMKQRRQPFRLRPDKRFKTPDWAKTAVWYQIFPERFRNGDPSNDPPTAVPWQHEWFKLYRPRKSDGSMATQSGYREQGRFYDNIFKRRYGGDLQGVREKLHYLRDLGITAIYFNPIFQAESLHKYDASDYRHIDDHFAVRDSRLRLKGETADPKSWQWSDSDRLFLEFLQDAHRMGFRVILDGVFNHVGREFWAFQDVQRGGQKSPYVDWFDITSFKPFRYRGWDRENGELPRLRHVEETGLSRPVREHLFAITRRWMDPNGDGDPSDGIDGWRLDVATDVNANFWRDWRALVKSINPDAYIVAEIWDPAQDWLRGDTFDAVMNYEFAKRAQRFFVNRAKATRASQFARELKDALAFYEAQVNLVLQNLIGSHDTDRIASMFMNPDLEYDKANRLQDNGPNYNPARPTPECYKRVKLMTLCQMTFLGAPMIYYGDEVGMYGADDPSCRKPMYWDDLPPNDDPHERPVPGLRDYFRRLIAIRNTSRSLQLGSFRVLATDDDRNILAYSRTLGRQSLLVVLNNSAKPYRVDVPLGGLKDGALIRLDDDRDTELVAPPANDPTARPTIRPRAGVAPRWKIDSGRLKGGTLPGWTGAVFVRAGSKL
ncbi:MAG: alpha amylase N-terminal ig-like domain-containing protein [Phycisphaerae bacterium]|nr:alpha amylase N-terminal ig-like domain-containing protein [Phycisphaerae bacterium]